jgi:hypothetical protein
MQPILKNFVIFLFELSTFIAYQGVRFLICKLLIKYGSVAVPFPETTPLAGVKSLLLAIRIGSCGSGLHREDVAGETATEAATSNIERIKKKQTATATIRTLIFHKVVILCSKINMPMIFSFNC